MVDAVVTGAFTLAAGLGAVLLTQRGERRRFAHEERLRSLDHQHDHRERLQADRVTAYRTFDLAFLRQQRVYRGLGVNWSTRALWSARIADPTDENRAETIRRFDEADGRWHQSLREALSATEDLEEALAGVALVASTEVRRRALALREQAQSAWVARREYADAISQPDLHVELWLKVEQTEAALEAGRERLEESRRTELGLDT